MNDYSNQNRAHEAVIKEIDKQNSSRVYNFWKSQLIAHARKYNETIDNKHFQYEGWSQKQCMDFMRKKLVPINDSK